jgi:Cu(I)/Ag(I) efflux system membrane fusion protein
MGSTDIAELERTGHSRRTVALASPIGGTVIARNVAQGARVEPGLSLLTVADLSRVWVIAQVYERDLAAVRIGQKALVELAYLPGRLFEGTVDFVYPVLEGGTRTASVRVALPNPDLALKPEMFAEVRLVREYGERLSVARHAVIETGTRRMVFVELSPGSFEPREIETGVQLAERVEVVAGLAEGERVLAEGAFFLDSESRLRAALARSSRTAD